MKTFIAAMLLMPGLAFADACIQDNYQASDPKLANKTLGCTANDIQVAEVTEIVPLSGIFEKDGKLFCFTGSPIQFNANFEVVLTAQDRYDIGLYLSADGTDALTGDCNSTIITAGNNTSGNFINEDPAPDSCGDISGPIGSTYNPQKVNLTVDAVCQGNGSVQIPNCSSWRQPGANEACESIEDAVPGTSSKCECGLITVPIEIEEPTLNIVKSASPTALDEPGGDVEYTVVISNPAVSTQVELTSLVDDQNWDGVSEPGDAGFTADFTFDPSTQCTSYILEPCGLDANNCAAGSETTCTFTLDVSGDAGENIKDLACIYGTAVNSEIQLDPVCHDAAVAINDVGPEAVVSKGALQAAQCADIVYEVGVENLSTAEAVTVDSLNDSAFGDVTAVSDDISATTCATPQTLGIGESYDCAFVAEVCTFPHDNTVTAAVSDDDGNTVYRDASLTVTGVSVSVAPQQ
jgi:hypothetical protein